MVKNVIAGFVLVGAFAGFASLFIIHHHFGPFLWIPMAVQLALLIKILADRKNPATLVDLAMLSAALCSNNVQWFLGENFSSSFSTETGHVHPPQMDQVLLLSQLTAGAAVLWLTVLVFFQPKRWAVALVMAVCQGCMVAAWYLLAQMAISGKWL